MPNEKQVRESSSAPTNLSDEGLREMAREIVESDAMNSPARIKRVIASALKQVRRETIVNAINAIIDTDISPSDTPFQIRSNFTRAIRALEGR